MQRSVVEQHSYYSPAAAMYAAQMPAQSWTDGQMPVPPQSWMEAAGSPPQAWMEAGPPPPPPQMWVDQYQQQPMAVGGEMYDGYQPLEMENSTAAFTSNASAVTTSLINRAKRNDGFSVFLMVCCFVGLAYLVISSVFEGQISSLSHPLNYHGLACGWDGPVQHLPYVYYPLDPKEGKTASLLKTRPMCVQECPSQKDVEKKAFVSVSDASAVNVGKSMALLSVLHSVRSPVYASIPNRSGYCIPKTPYLAQQLDAIIAENFRSSTTLLRSVASTVVIAAPMCVAALLFGCLLGYGIDFVLRRQPLTFGCNAYHLAGILMLLHAGRVALQHTRRSLGTSSSWHLASIAVSLVCGTAFVSMNKQMAPALRRGSRVIEESSTVYSYLDASGSYVTSLHLLMLGIVYCMMMAFCFSQAVVDRAGAASVDFALDPNGGIKIQALETMVHFSNRRGMLTLLAVVVCGLVILDCAIAAYQSTCYTIMALQCTSSDEEDCQDTKVVMDAVRTTVESIGSICYVTMAKRAAQMILLVVNGLVRLGWMSPYSNWTQELLVDQERYLYKGNLIEVAAGESAEPLTVINEADMVRGSQRRYDLAQYIGVVEPVTRACYALIFSSTFCVINSLIILAVDVDRLNMFAPATTSVLVGLAAVIVSAVGISKYEAGPDALFYIKHKYSDRIAPDDFSVQIAHNLQTKPS